MNKKCLSVLFIAFCVTGPGLGSPQAFARADITSVLGWGLKRCQGCPSTSANTDQTQTQQEVAPGTQELAPLLARGARGAPEVAEAQPPARHGRVPRAALAACGLQPSAPAPWSLCAAQLSPLICAP